MILDPFMKEAYREKNTWIVVCGLWRWEWRSSPWSDEVEGSATRDGERTNHKPERPERARERARATKRARERARETKRGRDGVEHNRERELGT